MCVLIPYDCVTIQWLMSINVKIFSVSVQYSIGLVVMIQIYFSVIQCKYSRNAMINERNTMINTILMCVNTILLMKVNIIILIIIQ